MAKPWQYVICMLIGGIISSIYIWSRQEENRTSNVLGDWWLTLFICAGILFFTKLPGDIFFLGGSWAALIAASFTSSKRNMKMVASSFAYLPIVIGIGIWIRGNGSLGPLIMASGGALSWIGVYLDWRVAKGTGYASPPPPKIKQVRTGRGPQRGGSGRRR